MTEHTHDPQTPAGHHSQDAVSVRCVVLTISDTRTADNDTSGQLIRTGLLEHGHTVGHHEIIPDEFDRIQSRVREICDGDSSASSVGALVITGGTGIAVRDVTYEAVVPLLGKQLDGFGELFRSLSYQEVGSVAMLSRAAAGVRGRTAIFLLPGSTRAVGLAMDKLILPTLGHIASLLRA